LKTHLPYSQLFAEFDGQLGALLQAVQDFLLGGYFFRHHSRVKIFSTILKKYITGTKYKNKHIHNNLVYTAEPRFIYNFKGSQR
jgi:hypothetical protein